MGCTFKTITWCIRVLWRSLSEIYTEMVSIFPLWTFHLYVATLQQHLHMDISQLIRYSRACGSYQEFLDRGLLLTRKLLNHDYSWLSWSHHFESFKVATMTWLTTMEYLCHKRPRMCTTCRKHFPVLSSLMTYHRVCN